MTPTQEASNTNPGIQNYADDSHREPTPARDEIARLAYELWEKDANPMSSPEHYWFAAERRLSGDSRRMAS